MSLIFKSLPDPNLTDVQPFPVVTVDWLRTGGPGGRSEGCSEGGREAGRGE